MRLGIREIVALGLLAVAIVVALAFTFLGGADNEAQQEAAQEIADERRAEGATATATANFGQGVDPSPTVPPAPTPGADIAINQPAGWNITYYSFGASGAEHYEGRSSYEKLDIAFERGGPFPDLKDGLWKVVAEASLTGDPGQWNLNLEYSGDVRVLFDGQEVATGSAKSKSTLKVSVPWAHSSTVVTIEGRDTEAPFILRWQ